MGRSKLKSLKETTVRTFFDACSQLEISDQFSINNQSNVITHVNGSEIILKDLFHYPSDPNYDSLGSLEISGAFIDECNQITQKAWQIIKSRIRYKLNEFDIKPKILGTCNPSKGWAYRLFYKPDKDGSISDFRKFIQALPTDNPHLPASYIKSLLELDKTSKERLYYGNWEYDNDPAALISYDAIKDYFNGNHVKAGGIRRITCDVARKGKDKTVIRVWDGNVCIKRYEMLKSLTTEVADKVKEAQRVYGVSTSNTLVDEDGIGCLHVNMEVMTDNGWILAKEVTTETKLLSKSKDNKSHYINPNTVIRHEEEEFIEINGKLSFTKAHSHFYKTRKSCRLKLDFWENVSKKSRIYHDTDINKEGHLNDIVFKENNQIMPNSGVKNSGISLSIPNNVFCKFLGWYLSEGYTDSWNNKNVIGITQTEKSPHNEEIRSILNDMGVNWVAKKQKGGKLNQYQFQHKELFLWIRENCYEGNLYNCYNKKLPTYIKQSHKDSIIEFCECFINGDGYYHKGKRTFTSSSKTMLDDIQECLFYCGIKSRIHLKQKKGSESKIELRKIKRTVDFYVLSEVSHPASEKITSTRVYFDEAINIKIDNETKCLLVRNGNKIFWTHNGGVVDILKCKGFVNNSRPLKGENYENLKSQCSVIAAKMIEAREIMEICEDDNVIQLTTEEMEQVKLKNIDKDGKIGIVGKDVMSEKLNRSPDDWDTIMMFAFFTLKKKFFVV